MTFEFFHRWCLAYLCVPSQNGQVSDRWLCVPKLWIPQPEWHVYIRRLHEWVRFNLVNSTFSLLKNPTNLWSLCFCQEQDRNEIFLRNGNNVMSDLNLITEKIPGVCWMPAVPAFEDFRITWLAWTSLIHRLSKWLSGYFDTVVLIDAFTEYFFHHCCTVEVHVGSLRMFKSKSKSSCPWF